MTKIKLLDKGAFAAAAPDLFRLLYDNMQRVAPFPCSYEEAYRDWFDAVSDGLKAPARQILVAEHPLTGELLGFVQYYTRSDTLVIEEVQILSRYHGRPAILHRIGSCLFSLLPKELCYVEAFVHKTNSCSILLQKKLGMTAVGTACGDTLYHMRGPILPMRACFTPKGESL